MGRAVSFKRRIMGFKFFHLPSHRVFDYPARHYDKELEKFDSIHEADKAAEKGAEGAEYVPGSIVSKGFRKSSKRALRKEAGYGAGKRIIVYALVAAILIALFYFAKVFSLLYNAMDISTK